ncbi:hypothetical protein AAHE18_13G075000 [Arachis hypogaea]
MQFLTVIGLKLFPLHIISLKCFVVATGGSDLTIWLLLVFVLANLSFAAVKTHRWYHQKFEDYPSSRFAVIPYIL